jgi:hypothetical protein
LHRKVASARRYTQDDQQINYSGDNGFLFVPAIQEWNGAWGTPGGGVVGSGLPAFFGGSGNPNFFTNKID